MATQPHLRLIRLCALALLPVLCSCGYRFVTAATLEPDTVLINGKIITVDPKDATAEALAIKDGKIVAIGSNAGIKKMISWNVQVIDLAGSTATPGLIDSHCHFSGADMLYELDLQYPQVKSVGDVLDKIKSAVATLRPREWVRGRGWDEGKLAELRYIYASDLDRVSPNNPVWITQTMGHYGTANSCAMKLANIAKATPNPAEGTIDRSPDGNPTGVLKESAQSLVTRLIPPLTMEQQRNGLIKIIQEFNKEGMTAVKDPGIEMQKWEQYMSLLSDGKLDVRVFVLWSTGRTVDDAQDLVRRVGAFTKPYISTGDGRLVSGGIKMYMDGSGGARTAWLYNDWNKDSTGTDKGNTGYPVTDPEIFRRQVMIFNSAGLHVSTHAIGDRAIDWVVDSYAAALQEHPVRGLRHGIIHCNIPTDHAIDVLADLQKRFDAGYPEAQSTFTWWIGDTYAGNFGPQRSLRLMPFKTYLKRGMIWGGGSDFNVTPFPARYGIWASVERKPLRGSYGTNPFGTEESIDVHNALRSYTVWNARQLFMENRIGSIELGKLADIAVWDRDLYTIPTSKIKDMKCRMTMLGGRIVYQSPEGVVKARRGPM